MLLTTWLNCVTWRHAREREGGPYFRQRNLHGVVSTRGTAPRVNTGTVTLVFLVCQEWHKESGQRTRLLRSRSAHTLTPLRRPREKPESRTRPTPAEPTRTRSPPLAPRPLSPSLHAPASYSSLLPSPTTDPLSSRPPYSAHSSALGVHSPYPLGGPSVPPAVPSRGPVGPALRRAARIPRDPPLP